MRVITVSLTLMLLSSAYAQTGDKDKPIRRFGLDVDTKRFPQKTPKEALGSILKAVGEKQFDYLLAQLVDPAFVDKGVAKNAAQLNPSLDDKQKQGLAFTQLVKTITENFQQDPTKMTELQRFFKEGEWEENGDTAVAALKGLQARRVFMKRIPTDRWVLLDREK